MAAAVGRIWGGAVSPRASFWSSLALDAGVALLLGVGVGSLWAHAGGPDLPLHPLVAPLVGAGAVGLLLGLVGRLVLRGRTGLLRYLLAVLAFLAWVAVAEIARAAWDGQPPLAALATGDDWLEAGQLGLGCLGITTAFLAAQPRREKVPPGTRLPLGWALALCLALAVLPGVLAGFLQARATADYPSFPIPPLFVLLAGAGAAGLLASLAARGGLRGQSEALRVAAVLAALALWVFTTEVAFALFTGRNALAVVTEGDDWVELGQLAVGCQAAIVGGMLRRRAGLVTTGQVEVRPARRRARAAPTRRRARVPAAAQPDARPAGRGRRAPRAAGVRVVGQAEDRCPYCLETVEKRDARGVVVCDVCNTPHHADCWEEAGGRCQVPHLVT